MGDLYIGLISGTSMDGIDAALVEFGESSLQILQTRDYAYPPELRERLINVMQEPKSCTVDDIGELDHRTGECFRDAAQALLDDAGVAASAVTAIGSHGQTLRHQPDADRPFTLQIGDPTLIATGIGITTVADFRSADMAVGGQGAPLTPIFHEWLFRQSGSNRTILNIGGIANVTVLADSTATTGFDTGPGNTLMDAWIRKERDETFDRNGEWAAGGSINAGLLERLLNDPFFSAAPPKSTGFEQFNLDWVEAAGVESVDTGDVQATLCALTAVSVSNAVRKFAAGTTEILVCGGGIHNKELMRQLDENIPAVEILSTATAGLDPDWVEAAAFAWLAMRRLENLPGNLPSVTGAKRAVTLGAIHTAG
jgi:anhydro-N-acetylmuramic acid kinase